MSDQTTKRELLEKSLEKLNPRQLRKLISSVVPPERQDELSEPVDQISKAAFLDDMQRWGFIRQVERELQQWRSSILSNELEQLEQLRTSKGKSASASPPERIPFTDREDKIEMILSSLAPPYYLIDAPAGYGKTELLLELERRFREKGWVCAYVSADEHRTLKELVTALSKGLDLGTAPRSSDPARLGLELGSELGRKRLEDITEEGLVFLIDFGKESSSRLVDDLLEHFIPGVQDSLRVLKYFKSEHNRFRVILAGRRLASYEHTISHPLPLTVHQLSPFSYKILRDTAYEYLTDFDDEAIAQIAAHIMYITGGHPSCMASLLEMFREKGYPPNEFLKFCRKEYEGIIEREIDRVHNSVDNQFQEVMDFLGIFRYVNYSILKYLIDKGFISGYQKASSLSDELTTAYLLNRKRRLLRNDSYHLFGFQHRRQSEQSRLAQEVCVEYIRKPSAQMPEMWAIEYLYQYLQGLSESVNDPTQRQKVRQTFLDKKVPEVLEYLVADRNIQEEKNALEQALEEDEEFRFTINYCLRVNEYSDEPYQRFRQRVSQFFAGKIGRGDV